MLSHSFPIKNVKMYIDVTIVGGGVVGLAIAAQLAPRVNSLVLLERHNAWGQETSSRNSEILHSGLYNETGSLKTTLCIKGQRLLYKLAEEANIPHCRCGKIIVAVIEKEITELLRLKTHGEQNGIEGLQMLTGAEVTAREPFVRAVAGLLVPNSGIINAHALMELLAARAQAKGAHLVLGAELIGIDPASEGWNLSYRDPDGTDRLTTRVLINSAGLNAQQVMKMAGIDPDAAGLTRQCVKGEYFSVSSAYRNRLHSMIYPVPDKNLTGLGIHTVPDLSGGFKLGPNAFYIDRLDYSVEKAHATSFFERTQKYLPFLQIGDLLPDMSGIRPKLSAKNDPPRDFYICHETARGAAGFFNLAGIDSPGLTASCAIGDLIAHSVCDYLDGVSNIGKF